MQQQPKPDIKGDKFQITYRDKSLNAYPKKHLECFVPYAGRNCETSLCVAMILTLKPWIVHNG